MKDPMPLTVDEVCPAMQWAYQEWCSDMGIERSPAAWLMWRNEQLPDMKALYRGLMRLNGWEGEA